MTRILRCDRCGKEISWGGSSSPVMYYDVKGWKAFISFDICPECMEVFKRDFMGWKEPVDGCQRTLDGADEPWNSSVSIEEPSPSGTVTYTVDDLDDAPVAMNNTEAEK